jgi:hypothetical protein
MEILAANADALAMDGWRVPGVRAEDSDAGLQQSLAQQKGADAATLRAVADAYNSARLVRFGTIIRVFASYFDVLVQPWHLCSKNHANRRVPGVRSELLMKIEGAAQLQLYYCVVVHDSAWYNSCLPFPCIHAQTMQHCQHPLSIKSHKVDKGRPAKRNLVSLVLSHENNKRSS